MRLHPDYSGPRFVARRLGGGPSDRPDGRWGAAGPGTTVLPIMSLTEAGAAGKLPAPCTLRTVTKVAKLPGPGRATAPRGSPWVAPAGRGRPPRRACRGPGTSSPG